VVDFQHMTEANLEMIHENDQQMEVDEIIHGFVYREIYPDKHL
jgi:hypothetical protein